jgi:hypothetical protein
MAYKKTVVPGKIDKGSKKEFKANKHLAHEKDIHILFDTEVDHIIEKLSTAGLPATTKDKRPITWHNNFVVRHADGSAVDGVAYSVLLEAAEGDTIVIYDEKGLHTHTGAVNNRIHQDKNWKEIRLSKGDPAIGIAT